MFEYQILTMVILTMFQNNAKFVQVVFAIPFTRLFTYLIPEELMGRVMPGIRVYAPFGAQKKIGYVVDLKDTTDWAETELKQIAEALDPLPLFTPEMMQLSRWIADYYLCGWGEVLKAALPTGLHRQIQRQYHVNENLTAEQMEQLQRCAPRQAAILQALTGKKGLTITQIKSAVRMQNIHVALKSLSKKQLIYFRMLTPNPTIASKIEVFLTLASGVTQDQVQKAIDAGENLTEQQIAALSLILNRGEIRQADLVHETQCGPKKLTALAESGWIQLQEREIFRDYYQHKKIAPPVKLILNPDQEQALKEILLALDQAQFSTFLLHGVTGSGKTQVYIEAIYAVLKRGKTAIVLVPEIALTPQTVSRFKAHFGTGVAVMHSRMSDGERYDSWRRIYDHKARVVIGPRSVIFAPLPNIGLIIVDEEHDNSYKQETAPRYHARDVAVMRAKLNQALVILGSATPSVESYYNVKSKKYRLLELPNRIENIEMPTVALVDMRKERVMGRKEPVIFSRLMRNKIDEKLARGEQVILLQNRRGFATFIKCHDCNYIAMCENCDISLTFHLPGHYLRCHYCNYSKKAPATCPQCGGADIYLRGVGTQKVEEELKLLFPGVRAVRMDLDTTRGKYAHDEILESFQQGQYEVLLGTQMVAKGLDFPRVTLVGVISADTELLLPDFRSSERTFQLITQVAGRAGRKDRQGEVIVQTFSPDHFTLLCARQHDFYSFFNQVIVERNLLSYPPFGRMIHVLLQAPVLVNVEKAANLLALYVPRADAYEILGPAPAPLTRLQGKYRFHIILRASKSSDPGSQKMRAAVSLALEKFKKKHRIKDLQIAVNVDPVTIL